VSWAGCYIQGRHHHLTCSQDLLSQSIILIFFAAQTPQIPGSKGKKYMECIVNFIGADQFQV
jgi:hypothetical protein